MAKHKKTPELKALEAAARPARRRNRRASGVQNMVEAITVHVDKATSKLLRAARSAAEFRGSQAEYAGFLLTSLLRAASQAAAQANLVQPATPQQTAAVAYRGARTAR